MGATPYYGLLGVALVFVLGRLAQPAGSVLFCAILAVQLGTGMLTLRHVPDLGPH